MKIPNYQLLTPLRFGGKKWTPSTSFEGAKGKALMELVISETPRMALSFLLGFIKREDEFVPVVILGVENGKSLFVGPDGQWLGTYIPTELRSAPFAVLPTSDDRFALCVDETSALVHDANYPTGAAFFDLNGKLSSQTQEIFDGLQQRETYRQATKVATQSLANNGVLQPWPLVFEIGKNVVTVEGFYCADEAAMNTLSGPALMELCHSGALLLAYSQLLSMQHINGYRALVQMHAAAQSATEDGLKPIPELDLGFMQSDTIRF